MTEDKPKRDSCREQDEETPALRDGPQEWQEAPSDPDPQDLGYEIIQWKRIPASDGDNIIFLPKNRETLREDAFLILGEEALCDLVKRR